VCSSSRPRPNTSFQRTRVRGGPGPGLLNSDVRPAARRKMNSLLSILFCLSILISTPLFGFSQAPEGGGIVYGARLGVGVGAPAGWVFDSQSGVNQGLHTVMYPEGSSWSDATEVMYVNIATMDDGQTIEEFIQDAIVRLKQQSPNLKVEPGSPITVTGGDVAQVRLYSGDKWGNREAVAYVQKDGSVAIYVLSCRSEAGFSESLPAFREMVESSFLARMEFENENEPNQDNMPDPTGA